MPMRTASPELCETCDGLGEVAPTDLNPDRQTLALILGESVVCGSCLGLGVLYATRQPVLPLHFAPYRLSSRP